MTVDIPDDLLTAARELARLLGCSLDQLVREALGEYIAEHMASRVGKGPDAATQGRGSTDILSARGSLRGIDTSVRREDDRM